ncbi:MAG: DNA alkylation repair protein [Candidatus Micrarchaeota archaeon]|nr:DNA alkylation repair protein [Candidatus Micrarchaeota archaeon]
MEKARPPSAAEAVNKLKSMRNPRNVAGMARFGINPKNTLGVPIPQVRTLAKKAGKSHSLAQQLWATGIHEARILAALVDEPDKVTEGQMEKWVRGFDSWDVCDQVCSNLFDRTPFAWEKAVEWANRKEEYVKRAGFVMMACLAVHDKQAPDSKFLAFLPLIKKHSTDDRNFVKKAVNWALRQIGKRNPRLRKAALKTAKEIQSIDSKAANWVAADAIRELESRK